MTTTLQDWKDAEPIHWDREIIQRANDIEKELLSKFGADGLAKISEDDFQTAIGVSKYEMSQPERMIVRSRRGVVKNQEMLRVGKR